MRLQCAVSLCAAVLCAWAQHAIAQGEVQKGEPKLGGHHSPYSGLEKRSVKALSAQQISDLAAGRGIGLALAAELNGFPGPSHVLELADTLQLSDQQRDQIRDLFEAMKAETIPLGNRLIAEETELDRAFAEKRATRETVETATSRIAAIQGALRAAHLRYHLAMVEILLPAQITRYAELRGYGDRSHHEPGKH